MKGIEHSFFVSCYSELPYRPANKMNSIGNDLLITGVLEIESGSNRKGLDPIVFHVLLDQYNERFCEVTHLICYSSYH
jgi:hypothetical protein